MIITSLMYLSTAEERYFPSFSNSVLDVSVFHPASGRAFTGSLPAYTSKAARLPLKYLGCLSLFPIILTRLPAQVH